VRPDKTTAAASSDPAARPAPVHRGRCATEHELSATELHRLTLYKWRYSLEALGFAADQARGLMFLKWLLLSQRLQP
jgi:hypothetical protein